MNKIFVNSPGNSSTIMIVAPTGAYYEDERVKGISHFLEHMCFKGTKNRTCKEIAYSIERYGGDLNAFTDWEITAYHATVANTYLPEAIKIIEDLVCNPLLDQKELDKEREVIIQELNMYEDHPGAKCEDLFHEQFYKSPHGLSIPVIGTLETLKRINSKELKEYYKKHYKNLTMIVVGNVRDNVEIDTSYATKIVSYKNNKGKDNIITREDIQQSTIRIGNSIDAFGRVPRTLIDFAFDLIGGIYNDMSGRLFTTIREKHNMVYTIRFHHEIFSGGIVHWYVGLGLEADKIDKARKLIIKELKRPFTKQEIKDAVTKSIGEIELQLDNTENIATWIAVLRHQNLNWRELVRNYKENYKLASEHILKLQKDINFEDNILVGVVPKK